MDDPVSRLACMFTLDQIVPWGRSFVEYRLMFALKDIDLSHRIVDCGGGPASFTAEATRRGTHVIASDPLYRFSSAEIRQRIERTRDTVLEQTRQNHHEFVWNSIRSVEELAAVRTAAMEAFLADYASGRADGRYIDAELPSLPFDDGSFDLALCSHFLFLYSSHLGEAFHRSAVRELCRVANEVRVFPLLALGGSRSPFVDAVMDECGQLGFWGSFERVPYEFQRGGNEMMRVRRV